MEHEGDGDTNCNWCTRYSHLRIGTRTGGLGNKRMSKDHPKLSLVEGSQNTEKNPGDLSILDVTQIPVKKTIRKRWCEELSKD